MKLKNILVFCIVFTTLFVLSGCGLSGDKFSGTWYGKSDYVGYKTEIEKKNDKYLVKFYTAEYAIYEAGLDFSTYKWVNFKLDDQYIATKQDDNTIVLDGGFVKYVWTLEEGKERVITGKMPGRVINSTLVKSDNTAQTEKEIQSELKQERLDQKNHRDRTINFIE